MDIWSKSKRSAVMSRIRSRNTGPELAVRHLLWSMGYRYRLHARELPGTPDIVFRRKHAAIFVHGCFWHLHAGCRDGTLPKSRKKYWHTKLRNNTIRDRRQIRTLRLSGWRVLRLWECEVQNYPKQVSTKLNRFLRAKQPGREGNSHPGATKDGTAA